MRLTLRNLLAYMDDLLDPESARIIGQKIEESEFASGLLHRIRDVSRRAKLGAPEVIDRKAALDPNTVAEYLDNTLPSDRVTDFEKVCLDSEVELAEVAACHQILTLVLGEPAEVRPEGRVRMYNLPETAASHTYVESEKAEAEGESGRIETPPIQIERHRQPAVPEYLLAARRRRRLLQWLVGAAIVLVIAGFLWTSGGLDRFLGRGEQPLHSDDQVAIHTPSQPPLPNQSDEAQEPVVPTSVPSEGSTPVVPESVEAPREADPGAVVAVSPAPTEGTVAEPPGPEIVPPEAATAPQPVSESVVPVTPVPAPTPTNTAPSGTPLPTTPVEPMVLPPGPATDPGQVAAAPVPAGLPSDQEPAGVEPMVPEAPVQGREVAQLFTAEEMALVTEGDGQPFYRIANTKPLRIGQRVVSLPTSRPVLLVDGKLHVEMVDGGELHLLPFDENSPPHLGVPIGRMVFAPAGETGPVTAMLRVGDVAGILTLADSTSLVAVEVGRADGPIQDPLTRPAATTARLWGVSGQFSWSIGGDAAALVDSPKTVDLLTGADIAALAGGTPEWVETDLTSKLDRQASGMLNRAFDFEKPADLILRENAYHRRKEVRGLARESLSWIGDFQPVVEVLNDPESYSEWPELIDLLRDSIRRSPPVAQAVRTAMGTKFGGRGDELYELLWKFDVQELSPDDAQRLVRNLEDGSLAIRVLSFSNLNRITKLGFYYRPEKSELERRPSVQRWQAWAQRRPGAAPPKAGEAAPTATPEKQP